MNRLQRLTLEENGGLAAAMAAECETGLRLDVVDSTPADAVRPDDVKDRNEEATATAGPRSAPPFNPPPPPGHPVMTPPASPTTKQTRNRFPPASLSCRSVVSRLQLWRLFRLATRRHTLDWGRSITPSSVDAHFTVSRLQRHDSTTTGASDTLPPLAPHSDGRHQRPTRRTLTLVHTHTHTDCGPSTRRPKCFESLASAVRLWLAVATCSRQLMRLQRRTKLK
jgi:hypothetical protein